MALSHKEAIKRKKADIEEIRQKMADAKIAIVTDYRGATRGMSVKSISALRKLLRESSGEIHIYKNTLCTIALKEMGAEKLLEYFKEPTAIVFGFQDPAATSKVLVEFLKGQKDNALPVIKAAYLDGRIFSDVQVKVLATLPSRDEMLSMLLRTLNAPAQSLVNVLQAIPRSLVNVLDRIREQKEEAQVKVETPAPVENAEVQADAVVPVEEAEVKVDTEASEKKVEVQA